MDAAAFRVDQRDNVATLLADGGPGRLQLRGSGFGSATDGIVLKESVALGHKVALVDIQVGAPVIKYGVRIGRAISPIAAGTWVHLHNCASDIDERSNRLDPHTGKPSDASYA